MTVGSSDVGTAKTDEHKRLFRHFIEQVWNQGDVSVVDELFAVDFVFHTPAEPEPIQGRDGFKRFIARIRGGFPDVHITIEDLIAEEDTVAARLRMSMTHLGAYQGIPPTGIRLETTQMLIDHFAAGQVQETWQEIDALRVLQALGVAPRPGIGPVGLIAWAFGTVGRFAALQMRHARHRGGERPGQIGR
jgi:steroid delta-isomerase-like uncharacterized protein